MTVHEGFELREIPGEDGFFARADGTIWTDWENRGQGIRRKNWKHGKLTKLRTFIVASSGYQFAHLPDGRRRVDYLVLEAFIGPRPDGLESCHAPDKTRTNNAVWNVRWDTHQSNMADIERKIPREDVEEIKQAYIDGEKVVDLAFAYDVTVRCIYFIINDQRRT